MISSDDLHIRVDELTENPTARVPVCLTLDVSGSMGVENKMSELNRGIAAFFEAVRNDEMAAIAAEIAIVTFGGDVRTRLEFASIDRQQIPRLHPTGRTPMGEAVNKSLDMLEHEKRIYSEMGVDYFQPWLVLMTDGVPTDDIRSAVERCQALVTGRPQKLTVFPIAIGREANCRILEQFAPGLSALRIEAANFGELFKWLAKSINEVSHSNPGDAASSSYGQEAFRKMSMNWDSAIKAR